MSQGYRRLRHNILYALRYRRWPGPIAFNKSWDVLSMLRVIEQYVPDHRAAIYDMGSVNCEIPLVLWQRGYRNIIGSDLDPHGRALRFYGNNIDFRRENFMEPSVQAASLDVMTALSVIEHGFDQKKLLATVSRCLKLGGLFLVSTDYHEPKLPIDKDFRVFGQPYMIFCNAEVQELVSEAKSVGLELLGPEQWGDSQWPITWLGKKFSFVFLAFKKR